MNNQIVPPAVEPTGPPLPSETHPPTRILVVDDEPLIRQLYSELLVSSGYKVDVAENGAVAWDVLQEGAYDLLITDNEMPRVTGIELLKKLQACHMVLPVIMVSGTIPRHELELHPWLHVDAIICKPFHITEFTDIVKKVIIATNSAELFRDCALTDNGVLPQAKKKATTANRGHINPFQRILVVDDDQDARQLHLELLAQSGYQAEGAKDGAAGWEALQTFDYDLVVTDNQMPRMTGVEMIAKLRSASIRVPVIMATGNMPTHEFARRPWLKPDVMLERPFSNDDLLTAVKKVLRMDG